MSGATKGWHEVTNAESYVLSRAWPPRFDIVASSRFPQLRRRRLARQVRQDLWRAMQDLRGFSPVLQIVSEDDGLVLSAGGRVMFPVPADTELRIQALLDCPVHRARWARWARLRAA